MTTPDLSALRECHGIVTRDGEQDACGKPATSIIDGRSSEENVLWPACAYHAHRYGDGRVMPLADLRNQFETSMREFIGKARKTERNEQGHECGHRFEVTIRSSTHLSGPGEHVDADYFDGMKPVTVRAHNLRDALLIAATLPLGEWFEDDEATP